MGKKRIYVALCLIALAMLGICFFYLKKTGWGMTGDKAWNELLDLDKNITLEQLEAKGYINVTGCLDEENETISEFIDNAGNRRPAVLRLTSNENDDSDKLFELMDDMKDEYLLCRKNEDYNKNIQGVSNIVSSILSRFDLKNHMINIFEGISLSK